MDLRPGKENRLRDLGKFIFWRAVVWTSTALLLVLLVQANLGLIAMLLVAVLAVVILILYKLLWTNHARR